MIDFLMAEQHPIAVPPELLKQWRKEAPSYCFETAIVSREEWIATKAAQWGADQELDACVEWLAFPRDREKLRADRRPKSPSFKEHALRILFESGTTLDGRMELDSDEVKTIRRALQSLPE